MFSPSSSHAVLEVHEGDVWRPICSSRCTTQAFAGAEYRVGGDGVVASKSFGVQPSPYPMMVKANVASTSTRGLGVVMLTVGSIGLLTGTLIFLNNSENNNRSDNQTGALVMLAGGGLLAAGIVMIANARTRLEFGPAPYGASSPRLVLGKGLELTAEGITF